jgi:hypothetical protein
VARDTGLVAIGEVLEAGREGRSWVPARLRRWLPSRLPRLPPWDRRSRRVAIAVLVVAVLGGAAAVIVDDGWRGDENDRLDACVRGAYAATDDARNRVAGLAGFVQPGLRAAATDATVTSLYAILAASARDAVPVIEAARRSCAGIAVRSWHGQQRAVRTAAVTYLDLVLDSFRATSANGREYFERNADLLRARQAVSAAQSAARHSA